MDTSWTSETAQLLNDLLAVQDELLALLTKKRELLVEADSDGLAAVGHEERRLVERLQECLARREALLQEARQEGLPSGSIRALSQALPRQQREEIRQQTKLAASQARLLKHHSLTNWVVVQRTLLHLSQLLEIIATGGQLKPTYGEGELVGPSGNLVDRAA